MGPVRLPFGLGSLCLLADVSEMHTCSGALKQTAAIRHSSRYTRSVGTRPWFRSNGPQTVGQRPSLVMNPPYHESYPLVSLYPLFSIQPQPSSPLVVVCSSLTPSPVPWSSAGEPGKKLLLKGKPKLMIMFSHIIHSLPIRHSALHKKRKRK